MDEWARMVIVQHDGHLVGENMDRTDQPYSACPSEASGSTVRKASNSINASKFTKNIVLGNMKQFLCFFQDFFALKVD